MGVAPAEAANWMRQAAAEGNKDAEKWLADLGPKAVH